MVKKYKRKNPKGLGKCIFCGGYGLSHEHIWPDWLRDHIPRDRPYTEHAGSVGGILFRGAQAVRGFHHKKPTLTTGDPHAQRIRKVCKSCNNGWMSALQVAAKPLLIPHIHGEWPDKNTRDQKIMATWAAMFTMVVEYKHPPSSGVSHNQRLELKNCLYPPKNWHVWCGRYEGRFWRELKCFNHFGLAPRMILFDSPPMLSSISEMTNLYRAQSTAFTIGNLFLMTFSWFDDAVGAFDPLVFEEAYKLRRIWPPVADIVTLPDSVLGDCSADSASRAFVPREQRPFVRPAWVV